MPKIIISADLHHGITGMHEIVQLRHKIAAENPDLVVIAGDIGEGVKRIDECLCEFKNLTCPVGVIAGNHDLWVRDHNIIRDSAHLMDEFLPQLVRGHGMHWLETEDLQIGDVAVTGTLGWYDYSRRVVTKDTIHLTSSDYQLIKPRFNNDGNYVRWIDKRTDVEFANSLGEALESRLAKFESDPRVREVLVVTHVPAFSEQLVPMKGDHPIADSYFGNLTLGSRLIKYPKVRTVVSAHTHREVPLQTIQSAGREIAIATLSSDYRAPKYLTVIW
jgi:predicted MPP superfamily phosphohydrolase